MSLRKAARGRTAPAIVGLLCACVVIPLNVVQPVLASGGQRDPKAAAAAARAAAQRAKYAAMAGAYDAAMQKITGAANNKLDTPQLAQSASTELTAALDTIRKTGFGKAVWMAMNNSALKAAVEAEAAKKTANALTASLRQNKSGVLNIGGAAAAAQAIQSKFNADAETAKRIAATLQTRLTTMQKRPPFAGRAVTAPQRENSPDWLDQVSLATVSFFVPAVHAAEPTTTTLIVGALVAAAIVLIAAYAAAKAEDFKDTPPPDETLSDYKKCTNSVEATLTKCVADAKGDNWFKAWCATEYTARQTACLLLPQ